MQTQKTSPGSRLLNDFIFKPLKTIFTRFRRVKEKKKDPDTQKRRILWRKGLNRHPLLPGIEFYYFLCV